MEDMNLSKQQRIHLLNICEQLKANPENDTSSINELITFIRSKKYGLSFEHHKEQVDIDIETNIPIFEEQTKKYIHTVNEPNFNFLLEGDNLYSLKLLQKTHTNKIDIIYIDPPYNTGNKDFVYNDKTVDKDDGYRHSKWLSFMNERLKIARELLTDNGVIFISIDDNEQANLKLLCDEIFGENNFLNQFCWVTNIAGRQIISSGAARTYETILVYAKNLSKVSQFLISTKFAKSKMPDTYKGFNKEIFTDSYGEYVIGDTLYNHNRKFNEETRRNLVYSIFYNPDTGDILPGDIGSAIDGYVEILPHSNGDGVHKYHAWRWSRPKVEKEKYNLIVETKSNGNFELYTKKTRL